MTTIEFTRDAEQDLINIFLHGVAQFGSNQAERYLDRINAQIEIAAQHPDFGSDYSFVMAGLRRYEVTSHAVYYRVTSSGILVLRVLHGRMDPGRHLY